MHQAILAFREKQGSSDYKHNLRFIRSCSSALPPSTAEQLETIFAVPVLEAYGMTEAAHQMAVNPLPPGQRKPGSVGQAAGCHVAIMDKAGQLQPPGSIGEIVVRGQNVITGYENNQSANQTNFVNNWFRTGDQGYIDEAGYIFLNGRLKEMINRGGEKISPREIDEVLLRHPGISQVAAFAVEHQVLGEDLAVAIVTKPGVSLSKKEVRQFAAQSLAHFKVPSQIVFVPDIPKGPTGKVQRVHLAKQLGIGAAVEGEQRELKPLESDLAITIKGYWQEVFSGIDVGSEDDFFSLGGNSIQAMQIIARIRESTGITVKFSDFFDSPTIRELAAFVGSKQR
jgi:acyl-CoA synthetase (AMP-forming)/AMP-acid ligase II/acyl carrier protein